ncbi:hypothetical protein GF337_12625 [candidate division KSB1 bacterium]|nr:hypothetical protein [candidate division KSB1 bacterium]
MTVFKIHLLFFFIAFLATDGLEFSYAGEDTDNSRKTNAPPPDSARSGKQLSQLDSLISQYDFGYSSTHEYQPMNPYFKDIYRFTYDLRRLFRFVDRRSVRGYESIDELYDIIQDFSKEKQTMMIGAGIAGGAVNYLSVLTNRQLARNRIKFLRWKLEKLYMNKSFRFLRLNYYYGYNMRGYGFSIPKYRFYYSHHVRDRYQSDSYTLWFSRKFGFNYTRYNQYQLFTPLFRTDFGYFAFSYDRARSILTSRYQIRKSPRLVIRLYYVRSLDNRYSDRFMGEFLFKR